MFARLQPKGAEEIEWKSMFCLSVLARLIAPSSELQIAESWYEKTVLPNILGIPIEKINDDRLYRVLDRILPHKDAVCEHLQKRYQDLFGTQFDFLLYDVTSTYFEGQCKRNEQAKRGYSRDHRPDCLQICIGLVVSKEGLKAEDEAVLIVYRRPDQPVTCPKPDIDVELENTKLIISVDKFGGCSPYTLRITAPANDIDILATIDEVEKEKVVDLGVAPEDDTIQIELRNRYDGSYYYCFKIENGVISGGEIPCP